VTFFVCFSPHSLTHNSPTLTHSRLKNLFLPHPPTYPPTQSVRCQSGSGGPSVTLRGSHTYKNFLHPRTQPRTHPLTRLLTHSLTHHCLDRPTLPTQPTANSRTGAVRPTLANCRTFNTHATPTATCCPYRAVYDDEGEDTCSCRCQS